MSDMDDFLSDSAALFGDTPPDDGTIRYGSLTLTVAPKEGKANTLLADHLFSPSLLLAELIERGVISLEGKTVVELGAGCALPSLLSATLPNPPELVVITDYPDPTIIGNLTANVERNRPHYNDACSVHSTGYEWGQEVGRLLDISKRQTTGSFDAFDVVIMSDLLHFDRSHDVLLQSLLSLLRKTPSARAYIAAGKYTPPHVCGYFISEARRAGLAVEEREVENGWRGSLEVSGGGLDREQLGVRKDMSYVLNQRVNHSQLSEGYRFWARWWATRTCRCIDTRTGHCFRATFMGQDEAVNDATFGFLRGLGYDTSTMKNDVDLMGYFHENPVVG